MNRTHATVLLSALSLSLALAAAGQPRSKTGGFSELHRASVADANSAEVVMGLVERDGESISDNHYHPGGEFGSVLEGTVLSETEGQQRKPLRAGDSFYRPAGEWHVISTDAGGAKTVVYPVLQKGQPVVVSVD